jgi:hypothetical protein
LSLNVVSVVAALVIEKFFTVPLFVGFYVHLFKCFVQPQMNSNSISRVPVRMVTMLFLGGVYVNFIYSNSNILLIWVFNLIASLCPVSEPLENGNGLSSSESCCPRLRT